MQPRRKGVLLAGGAGTRLHPMTLAACKQLLPVYDKPLVYYPLSLLMLAGIQDVLVITTPDDAPAFRRLLGDGGRWGMRLSYAVQPKPEGIAQALVIGERFLDGAPSCLVLGDNILYGQGLRPRLEEVSAGSQGAVFGYPVRDPERYGVAVFDDYGQLIDILEKPAQAPSRFAIVGLYFYGPEAPQVAAGLRPGPRGELEITDLNRALLREGKLRLVRLGRGDAWLDCGTPDSLLEAAGFVATLEKRQGFKVACLEEIALRQGWIDAAALREQAWPLRHSDYGAYLMRLAEDAGA